MAAQSKLTPQELTSARNAWESDPRKGFPRIIEELNLPVSTEALRLRSRRDGWKKGGNPSLDGSKSKLEDHNPNVTRRNQKVAEEVAKQVKKPQLMHWCG
jgi:hypothetical protein